MPYHTQSAHTQKKSCELILRNTILRVRKIHLKRLKNKPWVTWLVWGRARIWTQVSDFSYVLSDLRWVTWPLCLRLKASAENGHVHSLYPPVPEGRPRSAWTLWRARIFSNCQVRQELVSSSLAVRMWTMTLHHFVDLLRIAASFTFSSHMEVTYRRPVVFSVTSLRCNKQGAVYLHICLCINTSVSLHEAWETMFLGSGGTRVNTFSCFGSICWARNFWIEPWKMNPAGALWQNELS